MNETWYLLLIPCLPLLGFLINGLGWVVFRAHWPRSLVNLVAVGSVAGAFIVAVAAFLKLKGLGNEEYLLYNAFTWIQIEVVPGRVLDASFLLVFDRLSAVMCLVVTGVGGLIHLYSTGYMSHDKAFARYFAYLNLFTFAMLCLVLGGNLLVMFLGWEGVGLCSYLLIGFWYEDDEKASAGKKAFIVNRIGDFGFLIGIFLIFTFLGTITFSDMKAAAPLLDGMTVMGISAATFICLALFVGATGKSAQIPLYVWLPDAMAGPTPVSALIHAATMVTAGVYMIGRLNFLYVMSPAAMMVVAAVGVGTALFSATIGFTQNDIKKVLAYSTVSQLGFMFTAMGVGAFSAGIFHLTTHAFFKALLFLGAGSVIHGLGGEQDMRKMGALRKYMPITCWTMAAGWLAISGVFGLSGFVSKDEILWKAFSTTAHPAWFSSAVYAVGLIAAACTAIYMTRLMMLTFFTPSRMDHEAEHHAHESPWNMTVVLIALAALSLFAGLLNWPKLLGGGAAFEHWLEPVMDSALPVSATARVITEHAEHGLEMGLMGLSVLIAVTAIVGIYFLYSAWKEKTAKIAEAFGPLYDASYHKYWVDEIYSATVIEPAKSVSYYILYRLVDVNVVDGIANGIGSLAKGLAEAGKKLQTGVVSTYAVAIVFGLAAMLTLLTYLVGL